VADRRNQFGSGYCAPEFALPAKFLTLASQPKPQTFVDPRHAAGKNAFSTLYWAARPHRRLVGGTFLA
jgi:hypothetical protein